MGDMEGGIWGDYLPQDRSRSFAETLRSIAVRMATIGEKAERVGETARRYVGSFVFAERDVPNLEYRLAN